MNLEDEKEFKYDLVNEPADKESLLEKNKVKRKEQRNLERIEKFRYVYENAKKVYIAMIVGIVLCLLIAGMGCALAAKSNSVIAIILIVGGFISAAAFGWGIYATYRYAHKCEEFLISNNTNKDPEEIDQSTERTFLNVALYLLMIMFLVFLLLSICCFAFQNQIKYEIQGIGQNSTKWKKYFGSLSYETVINYSSTIMTTVGLFSLFLTIFLGFLLYLAFKMLGSYRTWQTIVEFVCVMFFKLGFVFLYLAVYAHKYRDVAKVEKAMPTWIPDALLVTSLIAIGIAVYGYISSWSENLKMLKIFSLLTVLFTAVIVILSIGGALYAVKFQDIFDKKCFAVLDYIQTDYLVKYVGCDQKYLFTSKSIDGMKCPKDRVVTAWEANLGIDVDKQVDSYGCIDLGCCYSTYSFIKNKIDYMALIGFTLFVFGCLLTGGSWYMVNQLEAGLEEGLSAKKTRYSLYVMVGVVIILMIIYIALIPSPPTPSPLEVTPVDTAPSNNTQVDSNLILHRNETVIVDKTKQDIQNEIKQNTSVKTDTSKCQGNCLQLKYYYELSSNDGSFKPAADVSNLNIIKNEAQGNGWVVSFNGDANNLDKFIDYFKFYPNCPLLPANIHVKVTATAYNPNINNSTSFVQLKKIKLRKANQSTNNQTGTSSPIIFNATLNSQVIDYSKLIEGNTYNVIDNNFSNSLVTDQTQVITGKVLQVVDLTTQTPIQGANIKITPTAYPQCGTQSYTTDATGVFTSKGLYVMVKDLPTQYKVDVNFNGLTPYTKNVIVGGIGWSNEINLGDIKLWNPTMLEKTDVSSVVLNSIDNTKIQNVTVSLWQGYKDFKTEENQPSFVQLRQSTNVTTQPASVLLNSSMTDQNGLFLMQGLDPNSYTLVFEKEGFYREVICKNFIIINIRYRCNW